MSLRYKGANVIDDKADKVGSRRKFGVELEVCRAPDYFNLAGKTPFAVKCDGSVNGDGLEFVSPILAGDAGLEAVENLCEFATSADWRCDNSCGFHLHIDIRDLSNEERVRIYYAYKLTEALWHKFVSRRRRNNTFCRLIPFGAGQIRRSADFEFLLDEVEYNHCRYIWCNIAASRSHGTIEIRLHHGTTDTVAVSNWIKAHLRFVEVVRGLTLEQIRARFADQSELTRMVELERIWQDAELSRYYRRRAGAYRQPISA